MKHQISVALCTCNGANYIYHQLESIANQTVPVDEIVVCDDSSDDDTIAIVEQFQRESDIPVHCHVNEPRLGVCANFNEAIGLCSGDVIFLSDQDDIWLPEKVKTTIEWLDSHEDKEVVFSNGYYMDDDEQPFTSRLMFDAVGFTPRAMRLFDKGYQLEALLPHNRATGAAMAFRKSFVPQLSLDRLAAAHDKEVLHDYAIVLAAASVQQLGYIREPLIRYRIHKGQQQGFGEWLEKPPTTSNLLKPRKFADEKLEYILPCAKSRALFYRERRGFRNLLSRWKVVTHWGAYKKHYGDSYLMAFFYDMFYCF